MHNMAGNVASLDLPKYEVIGAARAYTRDYNANICNSITTKVANGSKKTFFGEECI